MMALTLRSTCAAIAVIQWACGGAPRAPAPAPANAIVPAASATAPGASDHALSRSAVRATVAPGLGAFLQHVEVEDKPVWVGGKFHGFRIAVLRDDRFWSGVDLKAGDVVTSVNGMPIERPQQAQAVFDS